MPRLIMKCRYIKNGSEKQANHLKNMVKYIATRDGVEKGYYVHSSSSETNKQKELIEDIVLNLPDAKNSFEYEDYKRNPTMKNASEFITAALEQNLDAAFQKKNYMDYISHRPRVEKVEDTHGLFTDAGIPVVLSAVQDEVAGHRGNVWTSIISLKREDAERLGYDNAAAWRALLRSKRNKIAQAMKIQPGDLKWYAAFHNEGHHPHIHFVAYSTDPTKGYLTNQGMELMKSELACEIFRDDLYEIYTEKTQARNTFNETAGAELDEIIAQIKCGAYENEKLEGMIMKLSAMLGSRKGKKVYGYLSLSQKKLVDSIVDELSAIAPIYKAYKNWYRFRKEVLKTYENGMSDELPALSSQKELSKIKNMIIREILRIDSEGFTEEAHEWFQETDAVDSGYADLSEVEHVNSDDIKHAENVQREEYQKRSVLYTTGNLLGHMNNLFREQAIKNDNSRQFEQIDRKRRKELARKKQGVGLKW